MKTLRVAVLSLSVLTLAACATTDSTSYRPSKYPQTRYVQDTDYIIHYEKTAQRRNFVHVNWVNLPMKRVAVEEAGE